MLMLREAEVEEDLLQLIQVEAEDEETKREESLHRPAPITPLQLRTLLRVITVARLGM